VILTQQKLIEQLRAHDIHVGPQTIHAWVRAGAPTVPGWKKPRFILAKVMEWLDAVGQVDPLELDVRDRMFRKGLRRAS
jgi:hypothetical protein